MFPEIGCRPSAVNPAAGQLVTSAVGAVPAQTAPSGRKLEA